MDFADTLGLNNTSGNPDEERKKLQLYINLKLASSGQPTCVPEEEARFFGISQDLLKSYREKNRLLVDYHCWVDQRIQGFIKRYLQELDLNAVPTLPTQTFILDRHGVARELSLPLNSDEFHSDIVSSYRVKQGVLHNPASDRRTTKGSFHVAEGGLPIPVATPAHGTAFDIAGKGQSSASSMREAIYLAHDILKNRAEENPEPDEITP